MRQQEIIDALTEKLGTPTLLGGRGSSRGNVPTANWGHCGHGPAIVVDYGHDEIATVTIVYRGATRRSCLFVAEDVDDIEGRIIRDEMPRTGPMVPLAKIIETAAMVMGKRRLSLAEATMMFRNALGDPTDITDSEVTWRSPYYSQHIVSLKRCDYGVICTLRDNGRARLLLIAESSDDPSDVCHRTSRSAREQSGRCSLSVAIAAAGEAMNCGLLPSG